MNTTESKKPKAKIIGKNGNVFNLLAICGNALRKAGQGDKVKEMQTKVFSSGSYTEALAIMGEYCDTY